jgi:hypothetical protein
LITPIEKPRDLIGGILIVALGCGFFFSSQDLAFGTAVRMGPGYFPAMLSVLLILLGIAMILLALRRPSTPLDFAAISWRGVALVLGSIVIFGLAMRGLGLAPTIATVVLLAASASRYARIKTAVPLAIFLVVFCCLVFITGLGLPLQLTGPWLSVEFWLSTTATHSQ